MPKTLRLSRSGGKSLVPARITINGYLRNVAITKVLMTNERWPFVLASPLHTDMIIGIDVKLHTACFTFVCNNGTEFRTILKSSNQKEMLGREQVRTILLDALRQELTKNGLTIKSFVMHRDGRFHDSDCQAFLQPEDGS